MTRGFLFVGQPGQVLCRTNLAPVEILFLICSYAQCTSATPCSAEGAVDRDA